MTARPSRGRLPLLWALVAVVLWSGFASLVVVALRSSSPAGVLVWSYLPAAVVTTAIHRVRHGSWRGAVVGSPRLVAVGLLGVVGWAGGTVVALDRGPVVQANLLTYLWPLLVVLLAPLAGERFSRRYLVAAGIGLAGTVLVVTGGRSVTVDAAGIGTYLVAAGAALAWALYTVLLRRTGHADRHTALFFTWALVLLVAFAFVSGGLERPTGAALVACVAIGVGPLALAFVAWDLAVTRTSVARVGVFSYLDPLLSTLFLVLVVGEPLNLATTAGMGLIVAAGIVAELVPRSPRRGASMVDRRPPRPPAHLRSSRAQRPTGRRR